MKEYVVNVYVGTDLVSQFRVIAVDENDAFEKGRSLARQNVNSVIMPTINIAFLREIR